MCRAYGARNGGGLVSHQAFGHTVMHGKRELRLERPMTCEAKLGLGLFEQAVVLPANLIGKFRQIEKVSLRVTQITFAQIFDIVHQMRGVALIAGNTVARVLGMGEEFLLLARYVA